LGTNWSAVIQIAEDAVSVAHDVATSEFFNGALQVGKALGESTSDWGFFDFIGVPSESLVVTAFMSVAELVLPFLFSLFAVSRHGPDSKIARCLMMKASLNRGAYMTKTRSSAQVFLTHPCFKQKAGSVKLIGGLVGKSNVPSTTKPMISKTTLSGDDSATLVEGDEKTPAPVVTDQTITKVEIHQRLDQGNAVAIVTGKGYIDICIYSQASSYGRIMDIVPDAFELDMTKSEMHSKVEKCNVSCSTQQGILFVQCVAVR
jgi:hypothetical protein